MLEILIQCDTNIELKLHVYVGQWPIFHDPASLPYISQTIWWTYVIIGISDPFHGPVILTYLEDILMEECWTEDIDSVWHLFWPTTIYVGQWSIFLGTVILPYIFNTVWWTCLIPWILVLIWAIDLYFMIKWFWIIYLFLPIIVCWNLIWKYLWM